MRYKEIKPSENFQELVESYWCFEAWEEAGISYPVNHETLPYSSLSIVIIKHPYFEGIRIQGPQTIKFKEPVFAPSVYIGIRFHPWVVFNPDFCNKSELVNKTDSAPELIKALFEDLINIKMSLNKEMVHEIEKRLYQILKTETLCKNEIIKHICFQLSKGQSVTKIVDGLPFSIRVIQKKFKEVTGISMKQYASNIRQLNVWFNLLLEGSDKMDVILSHKFFDQAHFINDFKRKMKLSPSGFASYMRNIEISINED